MAKDPVWENLDSGYGCGGKRDKSLFSERLLGVCEFQLVFMYQMFHICLFQLKYPQGTLKERERHVQESMTFLLFNDCRNGCRVRDMVHHRDHVFHLNKITLNWRTKSSQMYLRCSGPCHSGVPCSSIQHIVFENMSGWFPVWARFYDCFERSDWIQPMFRLVGNDWYIQCNDRHDENQVTL